MKYFNMLKSFEWVEKIKQNHNVEKEQVEVKPVIEEEPKTPVIDNTVNEEVLGLLRSIKEQIQVPSYVSEETKTSTILNEEEVGNVLDILVKLQENVFKNTPISSVLVKQFVWNIPREIYNLAMNNFKSNAAPCMNPLYWFYVFCIDLSSMTMNEQQLAFANAIGTAMGSMEQTDYEALMDQADEYETMISEEEISDIPD